MSGCRGRGSAGGCRPFDFHRCDFVFQVHDDALGGFQPDAFHGLEQLVIAGTDDVDQFCRCEGGENHACRVAPDARHADEQQEEGTFLAGGKTVKHVGVFADGFVNV